MVNEMSWNQQSVLGAKRPWGALGGALAAGQGVTLPLCPALGGTPECCGKPWAPGAGPVKAAEMRKGLEHLYAQERLRKLGLEDRTR